MSFLIPDLTGRRCRIAVTAALTFCLSSCVSSDQKTFSVQQSRIAKGADIPTEANQPLLAEMENTGTLGYQSLTPLQQQQKRFAGQMDLSSKFSQQGELELAAENMELAAFIHLVFGDLLKVNYVIADDVAAAGQNVSLQVQTPVGERKLFTMVMQILADKQVAITERDGVFYIHKAEQAKTSSIALGFGRKADDVPQMPGNITQIVPVLYNRDLSVERVLTELTNTRVEEVQGQSAYSIQGERTEILRALDLLNILDAPAARGKHVGLLRLTYISVEEFVKQLNELLLSEGLPVDIGKPGNRNMVLVPLEQIGAVALFAADELYIERVQFWANKLDQPSQGSARSYFIYHPRYARASDLGASVGALFGQQQGTANQTRDTQSAQPAAMNTPNAPANSANVRPGAGPQGGADMQISTEDLMMTVDSRSNSIIFYTTGKKYQSVLPMVKRLDVMPKQILLEATIAEVTLTDEFAMGVEFAIRNGMLGYGTSGALGVSKIGGLNLGYNNGLDKVIAQLTATDSRVNLLSSPSIVVRDGVNAVIGVGSDIPTVGTTTVNPGTETESTSVVYRKTGVEFSVTPTISAQGLVVMAIEQKISNTQDGGVQVAGSPSIFERSIKTEVIAQSGQSILLGGLMSENNTKSHTKVPFLADLPVLGKLFQSEKDSVTKTELIILITPKVLDNTTQWQAISDKLSEQMSLLRLTD
jgi:general secretion pathway protein D